MAHDAGSMLAAVDLGSNSFHLLIARSIDGNLRVIDRLRDRVALAGGLDGRKRLSASTQRRALVTLERFGQRLASLPHESIRAVGTNTLRQAANAPEFLERACRALGTTIEVISGQEEARLIYVGVAHSMASERRGKRRLVVDIGGGSTECIVGVGDEPRLTESLYMGCVAWTQKYFPKGQLRRGAFERAVLAARVELEPIELRFRKASWDRAIGSSGTILAVDAVLRDTGWSTRGITRQGLRRLTEAALAARDVRSLTLPGLTTERALVLPGGLAILVALFDAFGIEQMTASTGALREGLLHDLVGRIRHEDARDRSVRGLCERLSVDGDHARRVERTALNLFDQIANDWKLDGDARLHLAWAARLHEAGLSVAHAGFHKHGAYLAEHSDLAGFSRSGQQLVATLIRCHRRKIPLGVVTGLSGMEPRATARLCALLRLAALFNRNRSVRPLPKIEAKAAGRSLHLRLPKGWLSSHALTAADLEEEVNLLRPLSLTLRVS